MKERVITGLVAGAVFIPFLWIGGLALQLLMTAIGLIAVQELLKMKKLTIFSVEGIITALATVLLMLPESYLHFIPDGIDAMLLIYLEALILFVFTVFSRNDFTFDDAAASVLTSLYVGRGFYYFMQTREIGFWMVLLVLFIIWGTDIGAYMIGRKIGKNKLAPAISPNKTIEGSVGGSIAAVLIAIVFFHYYNPLGLSMGLQIMLAVLLSVCGQMGDLVESAFKRYFGVKDAGKILPGHGGMLDRFDSTLFVMPVFHIFLHFIF